jgi:hypothetical protein
VQGRSVKIRDMNRKLISVRLVGEEALVSASTEQHKETIASVAMLFLS